MRQPFARARFRRRHAELGTHATEIVAAIRDPDAISQKAHELRRLLAVLAGKLKVHAPMEDEALYPHRLVHTDAGIRELARRFRAEFGTVNASLLGLVETWGEEGARAAAN